MKNKVLHGLALLAMLAVLPSSALALGPSFGIKLGAGTGDSTAENAGDVSLGAGYLVGNMDLMAIAIEGNIGLVTASDADADDTYTDELSLVALFKTGIPLIPAVLSIDFGAGIDQRFLMRMSVLGNEVDDVSGSRTLIPLSVQVSGSVLLARVYGEIRYNREIASSLEIGGEEVDLDGELHELLFMVGATF